MTTTLTITGTTMTSGQTPHTARLVPSQDGWEVSWLPGQVLSRNTAINAMVIAATVGEGELHEGHRLWPFIQSWAAELGLTGPDAIARASQPPGGTSHQYEQAGGHEDREAAD